MPTILIETDPLSPARKRHAARLITTWLGRHDVELTNVIVRFRAIDPDDLFSGPLPMRALPSPDQGPRFAVVTCHVAPERPPQFRNSLATATLRAIGVAPDCPFVYVEFRSTSRADVYVGTEETGVANGGDEGSQQTRNRRDDHHVNA